ncbi:Hypothetical_protein [Hexamita inflata]|uniref:Hypothetical_protein n=1 Tax=Hexamita inflata TaxID=28002 RepID=A0AA86TDH3_9EUKA|nr:Hypothetical protein HINF_LOCUS2176 [Hexamita inflata]
MTDDIQFKVNALLQREFQKIIQARNQNKAKTEEVTVQDTKSKQIINDTKQTNGISQQDQQQIAQYVQTQDEQQEHLFRKQDEQNQLSKAEQQRTVVLQNEFTQIYKTGLNLDLQNTQSELDTDQKIEVLIQFVKSCTNTKQIYSIFNNTTITVPLQSIHTTMMLEMQLSMINNSKYNLNEQMLSDLSKYHLSPILLQATIHEIYKQKLQPLNADYHIVTYQHNIQSSPIIKYFSPSGKPNWRLHKSHFILMYTNSFNYQNIYWTRLIEIDVANKEITHWVRHSEKQTEPPLQEICKDMGINIQQYKVQQIMVPDINSYTSMVNIFTSSLQKLLVSKIMSTICLNAFQKMEPIDQQSYIDQLFKQIQSQIQLEIVGNKSSGLYSSTYQQRTSTESSVNLETTEQYINVVQDVIKYSEQVIGKPSILQTKQLLNSSLTTQNKQQQQQYNYGLQQIVNHEYHTNGKEQMFYIAENEKLSNIPKDQFEYIIQSDVFSKIHHNYSKEIQVCYFTPNEDTYKNLFTTEYLFPPLYLNYTSYASIEGLFQKYLKIAPVIQQYIWNEQFKCPQLYQLPDVLQKNNDSNIYHDANKQIQYFDISIM